MKTAPGLSDQHTRRSIIALDDLWRHLPDIRKNAWMVAGDLADRHYLSSAHSYIPRRRFQGVELVVVGGFSELTTGYRQLFHVAHRHDGGKYGVLVHMRTGVQIEVSNAHHSAEPIIAELADHYRVPFQPFAEEAVSLLEELLKLNNRGLSVDPALFEYMDAFARLIYPYRAMRKAVSEAWQVRNPGPISFDQRLNDAYALRGKRIKRPPTRRLSLERHWHELTRPCQDCDPGDGQSLTPRWKIAWAKAVGHRTMQTERIISRL